MHTATIAAQLPAIYGRSKGLNWFNAIYKKDVIIIGVGGIGSHLAVQLSRTGARLSLYDHDRFESHNGGQVMLRNQVDMLKTQAVKQFISLYSPDCEVECFGKYTASSETGSVVMCGPDNIATRGLAFKKWADLVRSAPLQERRKYFFQDGRLLAEQFRIFSICGDDNRAMERYEREFLIEPDENQKPGCTTSQTTHCADKIASTMIGYYTNWLSNLNRGAKICVVPFSCEHFIPIDRWEFIHAA